MRFNAQTFLALFLFLPVNTHAEPNEYDAVYLKALEIVDQLSLSARGSKNQLLPLAESPKRTPLEISNKTGKVETSKTDKVKEVQHRPKKSKKLSRSEREVLLHQPPLNFEERRRQSQALFESADQVFNRKAK